VRDIAQMVGVTERATQAILSDLEREGYITREHIGRRNRYSVHQSGSLRHPLARSSTVGDVLTALAAASSGTNATAAG
jgi:DNA-binding Lrp family transcriptional regulator